MVQNVTLDSDKAQIHLSEISDLLSKAKKCIIITGAGISRNAGIPVTHFETLGLPQDFRSPDGLYENPPERFKCKNKNVKMKDLFRANVLWAESTKAIYYEYMHSVRQMILPLEPTPTHHFIRSMDNQEKLVRCYTQNFDGLESKAHLNQELLCQLHGNIHQVRCSFCTYVHDYEPEETELSNTPCPDCERGSP